MPSDSYKNIEPEKTILLLGPDFSFGNSCCPSWGEIAQKLAGKFNCPPNECSLPEVAESFEVEKDRRELESVLRDICISSGFKASKIHDLIASIPFRAVINFSYDRLLEKKYEEKQEKYIVVENIDSLEMPQTEYKGTKIVYLCGTIEEQGENLLITESDFDDFFDSKSSERFKLHLAVNSWMLLGWDPTGDFFKNFYRRILYNIGLSNSKHIVWESLSTIESKKARKKGFHIHDKDSLTFLKDISKSLSHRNDTPPPKKLPCVWKFLNYYEEDDKEIFSGREDECYWLLQKIGTSRLVILTGPSGIGKTSIIQAGLIPRLEENHGEIAVYVRCYENPVENVISAVAEKLERLKISVPTQEKDLHHFLEEVFAKLDHNKTLILFIDQFEVFFSPTGLKGSQTGLRGTEYYKNAFLDPLYWFMHGKRRVRVIFSLREEYFRFIYGLIQNSPIDPVREDPLYGLSENATRDVINRTADACKLKIDDDLIDEIINELVEEQIINNYQERRVDPSALQIICYTLSDKYRRGGHHLTVKAYETLGGAQGILKNYLEEVLQRIPYALDIGAEALEIARSILILLTTSDNTNKFQYRKELHDELVSRGIPENHAVQVLDELTRQRLVITKGIVKPRCELSHEYLSKKIRTWVDDDEKEVRSVIDMLDRGLLDYKDKKRVLPLGEKHLQYLLSALKDKDDNKKKKLLERVKPEHWELILFSAAKIKEVKDVTSYWISEATKAVPEKISATLLKAGKNSVTHILEMLPQVEEDICKKLVGTLVKIHANQGYNFIVDKVQNQMSADFTVEKL